ncbi:helix-hairpin-helix domain-containing protein [Acidovorax sp.]|uniref:helix-hairpin-helix domain-containing protein n=1 Tax=Acidovorax sp. TaxID=1872122 RepID=UPI00262FAA53|nr:helix-hairpin-helix domain-containing protein [Acidovorax sp.]
MLALHGVGATVVTRLEQIGFSSLAELADADVAAVTKAISEMMRSTCWHNSPQARGAVGAIVALAQSHRA